MAKKPAIEFAEERKERKYLRYEFTDVEMLAMGKDLARVNERIGTLEHEKEEIVTAIKAKITRAESEGAGLAMALNKGYEMRDVECIVAFHAPENGKKTITRTDTGEVVEVTFMDAHEMQEQLPLEEEAAAS